MKKVFLFAIGIAFSFVAHAQQNTTATGGEATGSGGTVSYSVGQIDFNYLSGSNGSMNEGVQQPYELLTTFVSQNTVAKDITVFPNPATDFVTIKLGSEMAAIAELTDASGKLVSSTNLTALQNNIDLKSLSAGIYFLSVRNDSEQLKQFKLIKNK